MNVTNSEAQPTTTAVDTNGDSAKLLSLLALAAGAVAMPQTSNADIVYTDLTSNPEHIGQLADHNYIINNLPGTAQIGFHQHTRATAISSSRYILGGRQAGYVKFLTQASFILRATFGQTWSQLKNQVGVRSSVFGSVAYNTYSHAGPGSFNNKYYMFKFQDSTQPGTPLRYGWISVGLANPIGGNYPDLAINGWAYDTTGQKLGAGQVPEPSAAALLALGALVCGSKGLRTWRKNRKAGASETNSN